MRLFLRLLAIGLVSSWGSTVEAARVGLEPDHQAGEDVHHHRLEECVNTNRDMSFTSVPAVPQDEFTSGSTQVVARPKDCHSPKISPAVKLSAKELLSTAYPWPPRRGEIPTLSNQRPSAVDSNRTSFPPRQRPHGLMMRRSISSPYKPAFRDHPSIGRCRLEDFTYDQELDLVGEGALGLVYRARHRNGVMFALKEIDRDYVVSNPQRVAREEQTLHAISHPNVVTFYCSMRDPRTGNVFFVMEYVEGMVLMDLLRRQAPPESVKHIMAQILQGVYAIHQQGIIHRDIKSENIMVRASDGAVKIIDFGLAVVERPEGGHKKIAGTARYMAPEVVLAKPYRRSADLYSVGIVLLEMYLPDTVPDEDLDMDGEFCLLRASLLQTNLDLTDDPVVNELVMLLCNQNAEQRWENAHVRFEQLKRMPYFADYRWEEDEQA